MFFHIQMSVSLENRCDFVGQRWSEFSFVYEKEREIREQKAGALPDREDSDRETWSFRPSFVPWQKNSIKDYFSICPIVQDQTREPNEEPEDLCKLKFCLSYSRITMLRVPGNLNIKTSYNQNIKIPFGIIGMRQYSRIVVYK